LSDQADKTDEASPTGGTSLSRPFVRILLIISIVLPSLLALIAGGAFLYGKSRYEKEGARKESIVVWLKSGLGLNAITENLEAAGVVESPLIFRMGVRLSGASKSLKAGEYNIPATASMADIMRMLKDGKSILHKITIPEGLTTQQIMAIVKANDVLTGDLPLLPPEGALLPETYSFTRGATRTDIIARMQRAQTKLMQKLWPEREDGLPFKTPQQAIILASIVEKETGLKSERPKVAAVFINRLKRPMRLQSDPTIVYGITKGAGPLGRPIRRSEIEAHTPYNTYQIDGLPPTPICNPGRASIEAVLNPPETDDLFFVADGTGGHAFSRSLSGHLRNVEQWRKIAREKQKAQQ
jgi:UPF0755 protein